jgi:hypothetical protein
MKSFRVVVNYDNDTRMEFFWEPWQDGDFIQIPYSDIPLTTKSGAHCSSIGIEFRDGGETLLSILKSPRATVHPLPDRPTPTS